MQQSVASDFSLLLEVLAINGLNEPAHGIMVPFVRH